MDWSNKLYYKLLKIKTFMESQKIREEMSVKQIIMNICYQIVKLCVPTVKKGEIVEVQYLWQMVIIAKNTQ